MKGFGLILFGAIAVISGITIAIVLIRKKRSENLVGFDDFDTVVSDEEFSQFFGSASDDEGDDENGGEEN